LDEWGKFRYADNPLTTLPPKPCGVIGRENATMSLQEFREKYERPSLPVVISGCATDWPAVEKWTLKARCRSLVA
jgi:hypothetical protein